jgi:hypothetical protein
MRKLKRTLSLNITIVNNNRKTFILQATQIAGVLVYALKLQL